MRGLFEGVLQIENNDPDSGLFEVDLSGTGMIAYPTITVAPVEIVFDTTLVNESSTEILTISNTGIATLNVTNITSTESAFTLNMTSFDLEPNESQEIELMFTPDEQMLFEGVLQIESNDPNNGTVVINLSGYGDIDTFIKDNKPTNSINVYPNPAKDLIYLENAAGKDLFVFDQAGMLLIEQSCKKKSEAVNVSFLANGTYILKVVGTSETIIRKIIISK